MVRYLMLYIEHDGYNKIVTETTDSIKEAVGWLKENYYKWNFPDYELIGNADCVDPDDSEANLIADLDLLFTDEGYYFELKRFEDWWLGYYVRKIEV